MNKSFIITLLLIISTEHSHAQTDNFQFSTTGSITAQYTQFGGGDSEIPGMMYVMSAQPKLQVYNVPISAQLRYVSGDNLYSNSLSQINIGFDINQFKRNLMEDALARVEEKTKVGDLDDLNKLREEGASKVQEKAIEKTGKSLGRRKWCRRLKTSRS